MRKARYNSGRKESGLGSNQQKIMLLLMTGVALGFSGSSKQYFRILDACREDWKEINKSKFSYSITALHRKGLVEYKGTKRSGVYISLTARGKQEAEKCNLKNLKLKRPKKWDGKWRIVAFDIPCGKDSARNSFRHHLKRLGFEELQRSVFIHPFPAKKEIEVIASKYHIDRYVTYLRADRVVGSEKLRKHFKL